MMMIICGGEKSMNEHEMIEWATFLYPICILIVSFFYVYVNGTNSIGPELTYAS
jgi:hypothetical protein